MSSKYLGVLCLLICAHAVGAESPDAAPPAEAAGLDAKSFCLLRGSPPSDYPYTTIRRLKYGKGTYGSVTEVIPRLVELARDAGADAIIDYSGSQRFGFWPWRFVRPVARGTAIKWKSDKAVDCEALGGLLAKS